MGNHFRRLDKIEAELAPRFPWQEVCPECARHGLTETPYEHCDAKRCDALSGGAGVDITPEQAVTMREAFERGCIEKGTTFAAEMGRLEAEDLAKREAWNAKKRTMSGL